MRVGMNYNGWCVVESWEIELALQPAKARVRRCIKVPTSYSPDVIELNIYDT